MHVNLYTANPDFKTTCGNLKFVQMVLSSNFAFKFTVQILRIPPPPRVYLKEKGREKKKRIFLEDLDRHTATSHSHLMEILTIPLGQYIV